MTVDPVLKPCRKRRSRSPIHNAYALLGSFCAGFEDLIVGVTTGHPHPAMYLSMDVRRRPRMLSTKIVSDRVYVPHAQWLRPSGCVRRGTVGCASMVRVHARIRLHNRDMLLIPISVEAMSCLSWHGLFVTSHLTCRSTRMECGGSRIAHGRRVCMLPTREHYHIRGAAALFATRSHGSGRCGLWQRI